MASRYLDQEVRLTRLTGRLAAALLPANPHCRQFVFRRSGDDAVGERESFACAERYRLGRHILKGAVA